MAKRMMTRYGWSLVGATAVIGTAYASWLYMLGGATPCTAAHEQPAACTAATDDELAALDDDVRVEIPTAGLPHKGAPAQHAHVTMIECSDFQCPFSRRAAGTVDQLIAHNDDLAFFHAHFPLAPMHQHAVLMARASVAAQRQGRFWDMHDAMFATRIETEGQAIDVAQRLGLDVGRFATDLHDPAVQGEVDRQRALCRNAGVRGVPTFFINGRRAVGSLPTDQFQRIIDEERRRAGE